MQLDRRMIERVLRKTELIANHRLATVDVEEQLVNAQHGAGVGIVGDAKVELALAADEERLARRRLAPCLEALEPELRGQRARRCSSSARRPRPSHP